MLDNVPAIVGLISGYMMIKQYPRARTQMKRIAKRVWNFEVSPPLLAWLCLVGAFLICREALFVLRKKRCLKLKFSGFGGYLTLSVMVVVSHPYNPLLSHSSPDVRHEPGHLQAF